MKLYPFYTAITQILDFYGIELDEFDFENYGLSAYRKIGNKVTKMKVRHIRPLKDPEGGWFSCIPEDCEAIVAITLPFEDALYTSNTSNGIGYLNQPIEDAIESHKIDPDELYIPGKYVKFSEIGDRIYFTEPFPLLNLLYKGSTNDSEGLPFITEAEAEAIAAYCAYCHTYKKGLATKDLASLLIAQMLYLDWSKKCSQARVPENITLNSMNQILDTMASHDRHMYGRTTKPIR